MNENGHVTWFSRIKQTKIIGRNSPIYFKYGTFISNDWFLTVLHQTLQNYKHLFIFKNCCAFGRQHVDKVSK